MDATDRSPTPDLGAWAFKLIVSALLATTIFMMKRLIDEQDKLKEIVWSMRQELVVLKLTVDSRRK